MHTCIFSILPFPLIPLCRIASCIRRKFGKSEPAAFPAFYQYLSHARRTVVKSTPDVEHLALRRPSGLHRVFRYMTVRRMHPIEMGGHQYLGEKTSGLGLSCRSSRSRRDATRVALGPNPRQTDEAASDRRCKPSREEIDSDEDATKKANEGLSRLMRDPARIYYRRSNPPCGRINIEPSPRIGCSPPTFCLALSPAQRFSKKIREADHRSRPPSGDFVRKLEEGGGEAFIGKTIKKKKNARSSFGYRGRTNIRAAIRS